MLHCSRVGATWPACVPKMYQITHYKDIYYQEKPSITWRHRVSGLVSSPRISPRPLSWPAAPRARPPRGVAPVPFRAGTVVPRVGPIFLRFVGSESAAWWLPPLAPSRDTAPDRGNE